MELKSGAPLPVDLMVVAFRGGRYAFYEPKKDRSKNEVFIISEAEITKITAYRVTVP